MVLDWNPVVGAKSYEIQVARNNDFTTIIETKTGIQGTNYSPLVTYDNAQYFWRVRSVDVNDQSTPWSAARSVFTRTYPDAPTLRYPADGSNVLAPLFLQWDPVPHASEYELQIGTNEFFSPGTYEECRIAGTTYTPFQYGPPVPLPRSGRTSGAVRASTRPPIGGCGRSTVRSRAPLPACRASTPPLVHSLTVPRPSAACSPLAAPPSPSPR